MQPFFPGSPKDSFQPVKAFINQKDDPNLIVGDDPRSFDKKKVFSAAPIIENDQTTGFVYVILASEEQASILSPIMNSYILKLGANFFFLALLGALIIGLFALWFLTRNLRIIIDTVRRFKDGDFSKSFLATSYSICRFNKRLQFCRRKFTNGEF